VKWYLNLKLPLNHLSDWLRPDLLWEFTILHQTP